VLLQYDDLPINPLVFLNSSLFSATVPDLRWELSSVAMATHVQMPDEVVHPKDHQPHHHFRDEHHHHPQATHADPVQLTSGLGHQMSPTDPENPQNWDVLRKIYASTTAMAFAFAV
jgi:hypothetical protein